MTTWSPDPGDHEVLSYGEDPDEPPPRRPLRLLIPVAAACLVAGFLAGGRLEIPAGPAAGDEKAAAVTLTAGTVAKSSAPLDSRGFSVPVYNGGAEEVEATIVGLPGWAGDPEDSGAVTVAPRAWARVEFTATPDCGTDPVDIRVARFEVRTSAGVTQQIVPFAEPADALGRHHATVCAPRAEVTADGIKGVWLVEEIYGNSPELAGKQLLRLGPAAGFTLDPHGRLFGEAPGSTGEYRFAGGQLTMDVRAGKAIPAGVTLFWRVTMLPDGRLHLLFVGGEGDTCALAADEVWVARRILREAAPVPTRQDAEPAPDRAGSGPARP